MGGVTCNGPEQDVLFDVRVHIVIALWFEGRTSGQDCMEGCEFVGLHGCDPSLLQCPQPLGTSAQDCNTEERREMGGRDEEGREKGGREKSREGRGGENESLVTYDTIGRGVSNLSDRGAPA